MADEKEVDELLDRLLVGRIPEEIVGKEGLVDELTKRLMERALESELTHTDHLGYEKHAPEGRNRGKLTQRPHAQAGEDGHRGVRDRGAARPSAGRGPCRTGRPP